MMLLACTKVIKLALPRPSKKIAQLQPYLFPVPKNPQNGFLGLGEFFVIVWKSFNSTVLLLLNIIVNFTANILINVLITNYCVFSVTLTLISDGTGVVTLPKFCHTLAQVG